MTRDDIDVLWQKALRESVEEGEMFTRYHFATLVAAAERDACAAMCEQLGVEGYGTLAIAAAIRQKGSK